MSRTGALLVLVPMLALGLTACGQGDEPTAGSTQTPSHSMSMPMTPSTSASSATSTSASGTTSAAAAPLISISDFEFTTPQSVAPSARIIVRNDDTEAHTVTSKTGGFDVKINPGATATLTAPDAAGSYAFVCSFHAGMTGTLVVK